MRVRAMGRDGRASPFSRSLLPALTAAEPPEAFPLDDGVVSVNFLPVQCAARYELQWRQHAPPPAAPRPWETSEASQRIRGTTVNKRNLPTGQRFEFRVRAFTEDGAASPVSAPSEWVRVGDPVQHFEEPRPSHLLSGLQLLFSGTKARRLSCAASRARSIS